MKKELWAKIAYNVDKLITVDVNGRGVIRALYEHAYAKLGRPLTLAAAERPVQAFKDKDKDKEGGVIFIATGWPDRPWISPDIGELDGPPGAAILARCLHRAFKAVPILLVEEQFIPAMKATVQAAGLPPLSAEQAIASIESPAPLHAAAVMSFPTDPKEAKEESQRLIAKYKPAAVIAIEKGSMNEKGVIHNSRGMDTTAPMAKVDYLMQEANKSKILTVGIGDGGNEVGMG